MPRRRLAVLWTRSAAADLEQLARWVARDSPVVARGLIRRLRARGRSLATSLARGRVVPELSALGIRAFRELIIAPHRLIYRVERDRVLVLAVIDGRRNLEDVLLERLIRS